MYGMTEAAGLVTMFDQVAELDLILAKPTSSGRPVAGISYKVPQFCPGITPVWSIDHILLL